MATNKLVMLAMFATMAYVLMWLGLPIIPIAPYLKFEPSDVPLMMAALIYGPFAGLLALTVKQLLYFLIHGGSIFGIFMSFCASTTFILVVANCYRKMNLVLSGLLGTVALALIMIPLNMIIVPLQFGMPFEQVWALMLPAYIPFNIIKGSLNTVFIILAWSAIKQRVKIPNQEFRI